MKVKRIIHKGYAEWVKVRKKEGIKFPLLFGKYQYIYSSSKGVISLIELKNYFRDGKDLWEILCLEGKLFDDVERFDSKEEAEVRIKNLLDGGITLDLNNPIINILAILFIYYFIFY